MLAKRAVWRKIKKILQKAGFFPKVFFIDADKSNKLEPVGTKTVRQCHVRFAGKQGAIHGGMDMSLILNDNLNLRNIPKDMGLRDSHPDIDRLDRYLAIIETNKKSCQFVPNDAYLALDMAGFAVGHLKQRQSPRFVSTARLALALVQPEGGIPVQ